MSSALSADAARLLAHLHRGGRWAYWWTLPDRRSHWWRAGQPGPVPAGKRNVYMGVHPVSEVPEVNAQGKPVRPEQTRGQVALIAAINCFFAEFDLKDFGGDRTRLHTHLAGVIPKPSVVVESGGGYHLYWLFAAPFVLDSEDARQEAIRLQAAWVDRVGADPASKDLARVLRVPGTRNYKYDPAPLVTIKREDYA